MSDDCWSGLAPGFVGDYGTAYGQVRTHVIHAHLLEHLEAPPQRIVDIGGGGATQAIPLAREGYEVVVVDPSPGMLREARSAIGREPPTVRHRVALVQSTGEAAASVLGQSRFDGVLCHGVLMYLADPGPMLASLVSLARPGAVISIVAKNAEALAMRPAYERDWQGTLDAFEGNHQINGLGLDTRADTVESLTDALARFGAETVAWYGVRLFVEGWGRSEPAEPPGSPLLAAELEASRRDPYRFLSRLFHLVARKAE